MKKSSSLATQIKLFFKGDVKTGRQDKLFYSHDASLFEIKPAVIVFPKDTADVEALVEYVSKNKVKNSGLSITARSGGTDMSGGAINDSIIIAFEKYFTKIGEIQGSSVAVQPGVHYRDFEPYTLASNLLLPTYPASRDLCQIGGMVANNAGGEKSLVYGKTDRYVKQINIVLRDGKEHVFRPLNKNELQIKIAEKNLESKIYGQLYELITEKQDIIAASHPKVSKNSTGYNIWEVWDGETFDITKLIVGSQGTLGIITQATFSLIPAKPLSGMLVAFLPSLNNLGEIINTILKLKPTSLESFDDHTLAFAFRFFLSFRKTLGLKKFIFLGLSFIPILKKLVRFFPKFPKIVLLIEFEGDSQTEIDRKIQQAKEDLAQFELETHIARDKKNEEKFWTMRRESFNLLRHNIRNKHTAPFIDDLIVPPETLPEFLPKLIEIMQKYKLLYTIAGHMGDGNFHIIPLMNLKKSSERNKIYPALYEVTDLVLTYGGSLSGEHNDGLIRGPMLEKMYDEQILEIFKRIKHIFDPKNIFNPHKKTDASLNYSKSHMRKKF